ncbi:MAG: hypothetical protein M0035_08275 [Actinomycetota bacterium]|nr:hypothetical protein [Actinomycetota bacterium]
MPGHRSEHVTGARHLAWSDSAVRLQPRLLGAQRIGAEGLAASAKARGWLEEAGRPSKTLGSSAITY